MTNIQFYIALGIPFFTILVVWIGSTMANRSAIHDLRSEINGLAVSLRTEMATQIGSIRAEMATQFGSIRTEMATQFGSTRAEMATQNTSIRAEMKMGFDAVNQRLSRLENTVDLINKEIRVDHEHRLTTLEEKVLSKAS